MPAAVAIPAIIGAAGVGASIFSGVKGANAATTAANTQTQAAKQAGADVVAAADKYNPQITQAAGTAGQQAVQAAQTAGTGVNSATAQANAALDSYAVTGQAADANIRAGLSPGGEFSKTPTAADIQLDPGFANRLKYGLTQLDRTAAARGGALSGTAAMGLEDYRQTQASNEFEKAYNRFLQTRQQNFDFANTAAGRGASVAGQQGQNLIGAGKYTGDTGINAAQFAGGLNTSAASQTAANSINAAGKAGEYLTQGANAQAAGQVGSANAVSNAVGQGIGAVTSAGNLYYNLKNPIRYQLPGVPGTGGKP